jgi:type VI secretion system protein ImpB
MADQESIHDKLSRVRKPHVHLTYQVYTDDPTEKKELPFLMGVMGDYAGDTTLPKLVDRKFKEIDRDNINTVMASYAPSLKFTVDNTLAGDGTEFGVDLKFKSMNDFEPGAIVQQVPELRDLLAIRNKLRYLATTTDAIKGGDQMLGELLKEAEKRKGSTDQPPGQ